MLLDKANRAQDKDRDKGARRRIHRHPHESVRPLLTLPSGTQKLLLHSCCAPCSAEIMETLMASKIDFILFFYNPNIHPYAEYQLRKNENVRFAEKRGIPFIDADYDKDLWFRRVKGLERTPERGERCTVCFDLRFERTALYAYEQGFHLISSTLGISRWKDKDQINRAGIRAASRYEDMIYWTINWRKQGGSERMITLSKQEHFYQQEYCGCIYSLRDTNHWRLQNGRSPVKRGERFYEDAPDRDDIADTNPLPMIGAYFRKTLF